MIFSICFLHKNQIKTAYTEPLYKYLCSFYATEHYLKDKKACLFL